jgi:hypothetical protein
MEAKTGATTSGVIETARSRLPTDLTRWIGSPSYYYRRHQDFVARHATLRPPSYYLEHGDKCLQRWRALRERLSARGRAFTDRAAEWLQHMIEDRRERDPRDFDALERDSAAFRQFASGHHPEAFLAGGLDRLSPADVLLLVNAPDARELLEHEGIAQAVTAAMATIDRSGARGGSSFVTEAARELAHQLGPRAPVDASAATIPMATAVAEALERRVAAKQATTKPTTTTKRATTKRTTTKRATTKRAVTAPATARRRPPR